MIINDVLLFGQKIIRKKLDRVLVNRRKSPIFAQFFLRGKISGSKEPTTGCNFN